MARLWRGEQRQLRLLTARDPAPEADDETVAAELGVRFPTTTLPWHGSTRDELPSPTWSRCPAAPTRSWTIADLRDLAKGRSIAHTKQVLDLHERLVPFASDPGGNVLCFDYRVASR